MFRVPGGKPGRVEEIASNELRASARQVPGVPATPAFQGAVQMGKTAMIDAIPGAPAATVRAPIYRTRVAKPQGWRGPIGHLAVPILAAAAGIGFNVLVLMTLVL